MSAEMLLAAIVITLVAVNGGVYGQQMTLVDVADLKVCSVSDCSISKIDQLQSHANELAQNDSSQYRPLSYNTEYQISNANIDMTAMDSCDGKASQFLTQVVNSLNKDLETVTSYLGKLYSSCLEIYDKEPNPESGYYKIKKSDGTIAQVYCLMSTSYCDGEGGWMRVGYFDTASDDSDNNQCPSPFQAKEYSELTYPLCQRVSDQPGCDSLYYSSKGVPYSKVCGRAKGYQYGSPDSFTTTDSLDSNYLDGVSLTYGSNPRTHIWSYVGGVNTDQANHYDCPCNNFNSDTPPSFVGEDYYCESGQDIGDDWNPAMLRVDDPLWDGLLCRSYEGNCCKSTILPWFYRNLGKTITDDIEVRMCDDEVESNERVPMELLELYVQ